MKLKIEIDLDNASMVDSEYQELNDILSKINFEDLNKNPRKSLKDLNGNRIGFAFLSNK